MNQLLEQSQCKQIIICEEIQGVFFPSPSDRVSRWREVYLSLSFSLYIYGKSKDCFTLISALVTINGDVSSIGRAKREYRTGFSR